MISSLILSTRKPTWYGVAFDITEILDRPTLSINYNEVDCWDRNIFWILLWFWILTLRPKKYCSCPLNSTSNSSINSDSNFFLPLCPGKSIQNRQHTFLSIMDISLGLRYLSIDMMHLHMVWERCSLMLCLQSHTSVVANV